MEYLQACIRNILDKRSAMKNAFKNKAMPLAAHLYNLPHSDEEFLSRLDAIILANISDPNFSNEQLAEAFCLSKSTLNRKIKGLYPHQTARRGRADADRKPLPHQ